MKPFRRLLLAATLAASTSALLLWPQAALAQDLPTAEPDKVGLSAERLGKIRSWLEREVEQKKIPGAVVVVGRKGKVAYYEAVGKLGPSADTPMPKDAIFRIYSMTKPLATVAAMQLVEDGRLLLEHPVAAYIPAFKDQLVAVPKADPAGGSPTVEMVPARRPITVQDLMRHTSGLTYGFFGSSPAKKAYLDAGISAEGDITNEQFANQIAKMPLGFQPGSTWDYSYSPDVLGRVIEVAAGKSLGQVLQERIFDPLGMKDTAFYVTDAARQARIAEPMPGDDVIGTGIRFNDPRVKKAAEPAGQGLTGTAMDYARFLQAMLDGGTLDGKRILGPATIDYMTSDHLGSGISKGSLYIAGTGYGFGLGFAVRTAAGEAVYPASVGDYWWGGAGGTYFWVDPKQDMYVVFMMQSPKQRVPYRSLLRNMVYAAITDD